MVTAGYQSAVNVFLLQHAIHESAVTLAGSGFVYHSGISRILEQIFAVIQVIVVIADICANIIVNRTYDVIIGRLVVNVKTLQYAVDFFGQLGFLSSRCIIFAIIYKDIVQSFVVTFQRIASAPACICPTDVVALSRNAGFLHRFFYDLVQYPICRRDRIGRTANRYSRFAIFHALAQYNSRFIGAPGLLRLSVRIQPRCAV